MLATALILAAATSAESPPPRSDPAAFEAYVQKFVADFNRNPDRTFELGLNQFSKADSVPPFRPPAGLAIDSVNFTQNGKLASSIDWRTKGDVCPVPNQGPMASSPLVNSSIASLCR